MENSALLAVGGVAVALMMVAGVIVLVDTLRQKVEKLSESFTSTAGEFTVSLRQVRTNTALLQDKVEAHGQQIQALRDWRDAFLENKPETLHDNHAVNLPEAAVPKLAAQSVGTPNGNGKG
jgi:hypothetical protein